MTRVQTESTKQAEVQPTEAPEPKETAAAKATTRTPKAKAYTSVKSKPTEAAEKVKEDAGEVKFDPAGTKIESGIEEDELEVSTESPSEARIRKLAFMEEPVTIMIHSTTNDNDEEMVFCSVNGVGPGPAGTPYIPRNLEVTIKRKFVEVLARAKPVSVTSELKYNQESGDREYLMKRKSALKYPFSVIKDTAAGKVWLDRILQNRA